MEMNLDAFEVRKTLYSLLEIVWRRLLWVILTTAVVVGIMIAYIVVFPPVYKAGATILVEGQDNSLREEFYDRVSVFRGGVEAETEAELLKVGPVVERVVERLDLAYEEVYHPFLRYVVYLWGESWVGQNYRKVKKMIFPPPESPYTLTEEEIEFAKTVQDFQSGIAVESEGGANVAQIVVLGPSPRVAEMADVLVEEFLNYRTQLREDEALGAYRALRAEAERAKEEMDEAALALSEFAEANDVQFDFDKERRMVLELASFETELMATRSFLAAKKGRLKEIEKQLAEVAETEVSTRSRAKNDVRTTLETALLEQELALVETRDRYTESSPEVQEIVGNIQDITQKLDHFDEMVLAREDVTANPVWDKLRSDLSSVKVEIAELEAQEAAQVQLLAEREAELKRVPTLQRQAADLTRNLTLKDGEYQVITDKERQAFISAQTQIEQTATIRLLDNAQPPDKPVRPNSKIYIPAAMLVGIVLGIAVAFAVEYADDRIRGEDQVKSLMGSPVYASLPLSGTLPGLSREPRA